MVEIILAVALFGLFSIALIGLLMNSYGSNYQAEEKQVATLYAQQGLDAVWSIRRQAWNLLVNGDYGVNSTAGYWQFAGSADYLDDNKYTRVITIVDACRDGSSNLVDCTAPGATVDLHTKKATSKVTYTAITGVNNEINLAAYLTTWQSKNWRQTDWSGGSGQALWFDAAKYDNDDGNIEYGMAGEIKLKSLGAAGCGIKIWSFDSAGDYSVSNSNEIEVAGGFAQLKASGACNGTATACGSFANQTVCQAQAGCTWNPTGSSVCQNNGSCAAEPPGQCNNCSVAGCSRSGSNCNGALNCSAYTNSTNCATCGQCSWVPVGICNGTAASCASFSNQTSCQTQAVCNWSVSYPSNSPWVNPVVSYNATNIDSWTSFTETATKNGGEIYYQLSDDDGLTWQYWNGSAWVNAGAGNHNTASTINTNINTFTTTSQKIKFKAFLAGNGSQQVQLDEVKIGCAQYYDWPFTNAADYTVSDVSKIAVTGGVAQLVDQGGGGVCSGTASVCSTFGTQPLCLAQAGCAWSGGTSGSSPVWSTTWGTYADWENGGNVSGSSPTTGGNPTNYKDIAITRNNSAQTASGYWQQSFVTTTANPNTATISFDWSIKSYNGTFLTSYIIYVFVDNFAGPPTIGNQVWSQTVTGTTGWATVSNLNVAAKLTAAGTYYIKLVARRIKTAGNPPNTNNTVGWDNVSLNWSKSNSCSGTPTACNTFVTSPACAAQGGCLWSSSAVYPTDKPAVKPTLGQSIVNLDVLSSFIETATKNGGEIYYKFYNGSGWYWYNGGWVATGEDITNEWNPASVINSNLMSLPTTTNPIRFKAFLSSNGSQQVQLNNVQIGWGEQTGAGGYATSGWLESSAFNTGGASAFNFLSWTETIPSSADDILVQLATAPDSGGSPGTWSAWLGPTGASSFYPSGNEILIPLANGHNNAQWVKYKAFLSGDGLDTPVLQDLKINYTP